MTSVNTALASAANPQQLKAIVATDGPVLIIAGPGSGKIFALVERIVYLNRSPLEIEELLDATKEGSTELVAA
jgi:superfamily I DNA/RNA helicase